METPLLEVHPLADPFPNLLGYADAQHLCDTNGGKEEGSLRVTTPVEYTLPLYGQDFSKPATYCSRGCGIPDG